MHCIQIQPDHPHFASPVVLDKIKCSVTFDQWVLVHTDHGRMTKMSIDTNVTLIISITHAIANQAVEPLNS